MKALNPLAASLLFITLSVYFTIYFPGTLTYFHLNPNSEPAIFISSPFNMSTEGAPLYNLYLPAVLIFIVGSYLKNFNKSFQRKCSLLAIFLMAIVASYIKSLGSLLYYRGYSDYGISLGTSIITLCFIITLIISLEVYIERKEKYGHLYGRFIFSILTTLVFIFGGLMLLAFFVTSSFIVHLMGVTAFLIIFVPYYERRNISKFARRNNANPRRSRKTD
ncbi:MAG: hypothetical protein KGH94_05130 [Candidatus Micrarchaeota archaeon]|nr:hypothetical protein [Candidatus Micrarchaeota archaeon]